MIGTLESFPTAALLGSEAGHVAILRTFYYTAEGKAVTDKTPIWVLSDRLYDVIRQAQLGTLFQVEARVRSTRPDRGPARAHLIARAITVLAGPQGSAITRSKAPIGKILTSRRLAAQAIEDLIPELPRIELQETPE